MALLVLHVICVFILFRLSSGGTLDNSIETPKPVPCTCGVFLTGQFVKGSNEPPKGNAAMLQEIDDSFYHNVVGTRHCMNKCLELIIKYLSKSADIICATIDRDCFKEKAFLFVKTYNSTWHNTNLSAGKEFCCKDNEPYKCPVS